jgi:predicted DNA-binding transcriptional regulator AlpA
MTALFLLMGQFDSSAVLTLEQVCKATGYELQTAYNERARGEFPIPMRKQGKKLIADTRDVAAYLDQRREVAA